MPTIKTVINQIDLMAISYTHPKTRLFKISISIWCILYNPDAKEQLDLDSCWSLQNEPQQGNCN